MATASTPIWAPTPEKMQAAIERLVAVAHPTKIILFGSQARGDADDHSDVDLLVIKPHVADRYEEMVRLQRSLRGLLLPVDLLVVSEHSSRIESTGPARLSEQLSERVACSMP